MISAGSPAARAADALQSRDAVVALLDGRPVVSEKDLSDYQAAQACYGEGALTSRETVFMRLIEGEIAEEAMRTHAGPALAKGDLQREAERIDRETRAPLIIACVKEHFASASRDYLRGYVRLVWIESRFRSFIAYDPRVQSRVYRRMRAALKRARRLGSLKSSAGEPGVTYSSETYSVSASSGSEAEFIRDHLADLEVGRVQTEPVETDYDIRLLRLLSKEGSRWTFESLFARKAGQADWFQTLPKMKLSVLDGPLRLWIKGIKGNPRLSAVVLPTS